MRGAFEFAVPHRGAGVSNLVGLLPYSESLPLLTSPPGSARTVVLSGGPPVGLFFRFFFDLFSARKNGQKTDRPKIEFFPEILVISVPPTSI